MYKISYVGNGVQTEFAFEFRFFQPADIRVAINNDLIHESNYSVAAEEDLRGGRIIFASPPEINTEIDIFRKIHLERFIDYQPTAKIDPERLNDDFNFLLEAFLDLNAVDLDLAEWKNIHDNLISMVKQTKNLIEDRLGGGAALGLYNNLLNVLADALPQLINDYGSVAEPAPNETKDDYGEM